LRANWSFQLLIVEQRPTILLQYIAMYINVILNIKSLNYYDSFISVESAFEHTLNPLNSSSYTLHIIPNNIFVGPEQKKNNRGVIIQHEGINRTLVNKVDSLMGKLKTLKYASLLRTKNVFASRKKECYSLVFPLQNADKIKED
jgi:hypothetical protein